MTLFPCLFPEKGSNIRIIIFLILFLSFPIKLFYFFYSHGPFGADATEYLNASKVFEKGIINYCTTADPYTFWRLPLLPLLFYLTGSIQVFFIMQLLLSYFLSYNVFLIIKKLTGHKDFALIAALTSLFLPYLNLAAVYPLSELLQVFLIVWIFKKVIYKEFDAAIIILGALLCLLRPEGFTFIILIAGRELWKRQYKSAFIVSCALLASLLWMARNKKVFDSFSLVNPIHSSRALIGSIYGTIYVDEHPFHTQYSYYKGLDYLHARPFILFYKEKVREELRTYIKEHPLKYLIHRIAAVAACFSYYTLNMEIMPGKNWELRTKYDYKQAAETNAYWSYSNLLRERDYLKIICRVLYHSLFAAAHWIGLFLILLHYKKLLPLLFLFLTFSYVFIVEADMRYFYTIQLFCFCFFSIFIFHLFKNRSFTLSFK